MDKLTLKAALPLLLAALAWSCSDSPAAQDSSLPGVDARVDQAIVADQTPAPDTSPAPDQGGPPIKGWAKSYGGFPSEYGAGIAVDGQGNIYITGRQRGMATFGATTLTTKGKGDIFVAKLSPDGAVLWAVSAGGPNDEGGSAIALDSQGNAYVMGQFEGQATFGTKTITATGPGDIFVTKLDSSGKFVWTSTAAGAHTQYTFMGLAVDSAGNAVITGNISGAASFGAHKLTPKGSVDVFVAQLSSAGAFTWASAAGHASGWGHGYGVAFDSKDRPHVAGYYGSKLTFGSQTVSGSGGIFVTQLDTSGGFTWVSTSGGAGAPHATDIAIDAADNIHVVGSLNSSATFGATTLTSSSSTLDIVVAQMTPTGSWSWATLISGSAVDYVSALAVDSAGNHYIVGDSESSDLSCGGKAWGFKGGRDGFLAKLDATGACSWMTRAGGAKYDGLSGVSLDKAGNPHAIGKFEGAGTVGATSVPPKGGNDVVVIKMSAAGTL